MRTSLCALASPGITNRKSHVCSSKPGHSAWRVTASRLASHLSHGLTPARDAARHTARSGTAVATSGRRGRQPQPAAPGAGCGGSRRRSCLPHSHAPPPPPAAARATMEFDVCCAFASRSMRGRLRSRRADIDSTLCPARERQRHRPDLIKRPAHSRFTLSGGAGFWGAGR